MEEVTKDAITGAVTVRVLSAEEEAAVRARRRARITADSVRAEAQRRIVGLVGVADLTSCIVKQLNANMRANELNDIRHDREWTTLEEAEASALRSLADKIKAIRAASNLLEPNPPEDYAANYHWPS